MLGAVPCCVLCVLAGARICRHISDAILHCRASQQHGHAAQDVCLSNTALMLPFKTKLVWVCQLNSHSRGLRLATLLPLSTQAAAKHVLTALVLVWLRAKRMQKEHHVCLNITCTIMTGGCILLSAFSWVCHQDI